MIINNLTIQGRIGKITPECFRTFENGNELLSFSIAQTRSHKNSDGTFSSNTEWFKVNVSGNLLKWNRQNFVTGREITIEGSLRNKTYTKNEKSVSNFLIEARNIKFSQSAKDYSEGFQNQSNSQSQNISNNNFQNQYQNPQQNFNQQTQQNLNSQGFPF